MNLSVIIVNLFLSQGNMFLHVITQYNHTIQLISYIVIRFLQPNSTKIISCKCCLAKFGHVISLKRPTIARDGGKKANK